jgi:adenylylsulfate kinase
MKNGTRSHHLMLSRRRNMEEQKATHIMWHTGAVHRENREHLKGHRGVTLWLTGLSASGKSTLAVAVEAALHARGSHTYILDGDNIRHGLNRNLGFSPQDRSENIRRISEVSKLFTDSGTINLTAFISPYRSDRQAARELCGKDNFIEVFVECPLEVCEQRDPKGAYAKARQGIIKDFTGISAPYEEPLTPEIHLRTDLQSLDDCVRSILSYLEHSEFIPALRKSAPRRDSGQDLTGLTL